MTTHKEEFKQMRKSSAQVARAIPETMQGFGALSKGAMKEGAVSFKNKELIALGIGISSRCEGCIQAHVSGAIRAGATREEMHEAIGVAILMSGGPGTVYGAIAYEVIEEFLA